MIMVISIVAILVVIVVSLASRVEERGRIDLTRSTLNILNGAIQEFSSSGFRYRFEDPCDLGFDQRLLKFPLDCNGMTKNEIERHLDEALDPQPPLTISGTNFDDPNAAAIAVVHFLLHRVGRCREILGEIDKSMIRHCRDSTQSEIVIEYEDDDEVYKLLYYSDPWGRPLRYSYYINKEENIVNPEALEPNPIAEEGVRAFPLLISAGPDGVFGSSDDIMNR